jgi:guanylate kinase
MQDTTRKPRPGEVDHINYHFVTTDDFLSLKSLGAFIESAQFAGNWYATSFNAVKSVQDKVCILDIEMQGVKSVKQSDLHCNYIFISPPSMQTLEERLRNRGTETEESIQRRLHAAQVELEYAKEPGVHDFIVINDDLDAAFLQLESYLLKEYPQVLGKKEPASLNE